MVSDNFFNSNIFATIIGGAIGIISAIFTTIWYNGHQALKAQCENYKAWCNGVKAEINHILKVIDEIDKILKEHGVPSTKRLNYDYLEQARVKIIMYESDLVFLEILTNAYRDIVHTNGMLDRLEEDVSKHKNLIGNTQASIDGVRNSVKALNQGLDIKISAIRKPRWYAFRN